MIQSIDVTTPPPAERHPRLDLLRGIAVLMMMAFHGCYDLNLFGYAHFQMLEQPFWLIWRASIVSSFVLLAGASQWLARSSSARSRHLRLLRVGASALLVSAVSALLFGPRWIYFGVLHFFVLAALITAPLLARPRVLVPAALITLGAAATLALNALDPRTFNWIGLAAHKPATEDYAPLLPWLGVYWGGVALQRTWPTLLCGVPGPASGSPASWPAPRPGTGAALAQWLGRHSLGVYLLHQPLFFALLFLLRKASSP